MKLRHRESGAVIDLPGYRERDLTYWDAGTPFSSSYSKLEWEPVRAETWRDVTGECEYDWCSIFHRNGGPQGDLVVTPSNGYRLRKVRVEVPDDNGSLWTWAFKVEKLERSSP